MAWVRLSVMLAILGSTTTQAADTSRIAAEAVTAMAGVCMPVLLQNAEPIATLKAAEYRTELAVTRATKPLPDGSIVELVVDMADGKRRCAAEIFMKAEEVPPYDSVRAAIFAWAAKTDPPMRMLQENRAVPRTDPKDYPLARSAWSLPLPGGQLSTVLLETRGIDRDDLFTAPIRLVMILDGVVPQPPAP